MQTGAVTWSSNPRTAKECQAHLRHHVAGSRGTDAPGEDQVHELRRRAEVAQAVAPEREEALEAERMVLRMLMTGPVPVATSAPETDEQGTGAPDASAGT